MQVLGIETSCDETAIAIYDSKIGIISHCLYSQIGLHNQYGGVVPELASREHVLKVLPLVKKTLSDGKTDFSLLNAIAYTSGPGLMGALLVGSAIGRSLAYSLNIPAIGVHHMEAHLLAPMLEKNPPKYPFLALLVSGGHTQIIHVKQIGQYDIVGDTLDDAAGEAFDKTAQLLGLGYPGGAALSKLAESGKPKYDLPKPMLHSKDFDFSFSGLKTAVLTLVKKQPELTDSIKANIAASFQKSITEVLIYKTLKAMYSLNLNQIVVSGGVGANKQLREKLTKSSQENNFKLFFPSLEFCTDNGAMIALAGYLRYALSEKKDYRFTVMPRWRLTEI